MGYMTEAEITALQGTSLSRDAPFAIEGVSHGMLSVSRHYGGCTFSGHKYTYNPVTDELIRNDVLKWLGKHRKKAKKAPDGMATEGDLFSLDNALGGN